MSMHPSSATPDSELSGARTVPGLPTFDTGATTASPGETTGAKRGSKKRAKRGSTTDSRRNGSRRNAGGRTKEGSTALPIWSLAILGGLFVPTVLLHEPIFGSGAGLRAAGLGVLVGLLISWASAWWRWDLISVVAAVLASHFLIGGAAALSGSTIAGIVPTGRTLQLLVLQVAYAWMDLLTLNPPAGAYVGPGVMPWVAGLVLATLAGHLTVRGGWAIWGTVPIAVMGVLGIAWGPAGTRPQLLPFLIWGGAILLWWAWTAQRKRFDLGIDVRVGAEGTGATGNTMTTGASRAAVRNGTRMVAAVLTIALIGGVAWPLTQRFGPWQERIVLRDLVEPPLDVREYPTPLSAFRHYTTDLKEEVIFSASGVPEGARVRIGVMDLYDGTTMGMSPVGTHVNGGFMQVGKRFPTPVAVEGSTVATVTMTTDRLLGPWVPLIGTPDSLTFHGDGSSRQQEGLHLDMWADAALTTAPDRPLNYTITTTIAPTWSDGQLAGVPAIPFTGTDLQVPPKVGDLAIKLTAGAQTPLEKARAIERHLAKEGFFGNDGTGAAQAGHRADRLTRMLDNAQLIGDDEQYAVLMALMLHSLGINARVVMGAYAEGRSGEVDYTGNDMHAWVEVAFEGVGWGVFDPTPSREQLPQEPEPLPRSVPRPQVLQPPEPPEEPAELPPATSAKGTDPSDEDGVVIPWRLIGGISGLLLLLLGPILLILGAKARRRARRRKADARHSLAGSWNEVVDLATDAGVQVGPELTRQEAAWMLTNTLWTRQGKLGTPAAKDNGADVTVNAHGSQWSPEGSALPRTVAVARAADVADFAEGEPNPASAQAAWYEVDQLRKELAFAASPWGRVRHALSLRSLRDRRRRKKALRAAEKARMKAREAELKAQSGPVADALGTGKKRSAKRGRGKKD